MVEKRDALLPKAFPRSPEDFHEQSRAETLCRLFDEALTRTHAKIDYYDRQGKKKGDAAKSIRRLSLVFFLLGTLAPLIAGMLFGLSQAFGAPWTDYAKLPITEIGYALLAISGGLVLYDQFFGDSQSWMRFREAQVRLEVLELTFKYKWASNLALTSGNMSDLKGIGALTDLLVRHVTEVETLAEAETKEWVKHFRAQLDAFDQKLKSGQETPPEHARKSPAPEGAPS